MKNIIKIVLLLLVSFAVVMCKKKVQPALSEINKDCGCAKEVSADFLMEEATSTNPNFAKYTETDTIYRDKNVRFTAKEENAEYTWILGLDTVHTRSVTRYFYNWMVGNTYPITLIVKKKSNSICLPNDDGYDSITKHITVVAMNLNGASGELHFEGQYKVKSPLLPDSTIISLDYYYVSSGAFQNMLNVINYDGEGADCLHNINHAIGYDDISFNYKQIFDWFNIF